MTTTRMTTASDVADRNWWLVDAEGEILGRLASRVAALLQGKHKPIFSRSIDTGDNVVVINASKIRLSSNKEQSKVWHRHSGYPGGLRTVTFENMMKTKPSAVVEAAVVGMLPKNRLGRAAAVKLKVYAGPDHPHGPQNPKPVGSE